MCDWRKAGRTDAQAKRDYLDCVKTSRGCEACGAMGLPARVYDFHHRDRASKRIPPHRLAHDAGWDRLKMEVAKCDVLCANCHRIAEIEHDQKVPA